MRSHLAPRLLHLGVACDSWGRSFEDDLVNEIRGDVAKLCEFRGHSFQVPHVRGDDFHNEANFAGHPKTSNYLLLALQDVEDLLVLEPLDAEPDDGPQGIAESCSVDSGGIRRYDSSFFESLEPNSSCRYTEVNLTGEIGQ